MFEKIQDKGKEIISLFKVAGISFGENQCSLWASSIAYFSIFAIFPLSLFLLSIGSEYLESLATRQAINTVIDEFVPFASSQINNIIDQSLESRGSVTLLAMIGLWWSSSSVFGILESGLCKIWGVRPRTYWRRRLLAAVVIMTIGVIFMISFSIGPIVSIIWKATDTPYQIYFNVFIDYFLSILAAYLLFRIFPNRNVSAKPALIGSVIVVAAIQIAKTIFFAIMDSAFVNYGAVYGSLAWMVALGIYILVVMIIFFFSAELTAAIERIYFRDRSIDLS